MIDIDSKYSLSTCITLSVKTDPSSLLRLNAKFKHATRLISGDISGSLFYPLMELPEDIIQSNLKRTDPITPMNSNNYAQTQSCSGTLGHSPEGFMSDMFDDYELNDFIEYDVSTQLMTQILPQPADIMSKIDDVGPDHLVYLERYKSYQGGPIQYEFEYTSRFGLDLMKVSADALTRAYHTKLNSRYTALNYTFFRNPSYSQHEEYRSISKNKNHEDWKYLANKVEDGDFNREYLVNMKLAVLMEEVIEDLLRNALDDGYFYKMLKWGGYTIKELDYVRHE